MRARRQAAALAALLSVAACGRGVGPPSPAGDANVVGGAGDQGRGGVAWLGRTLQVGDDPAHVRLSWPGAGLAVRFEGAGLEVDVKGDPRPYGGEQLDVYFDVAVDGGAPTQVTVGTARQILPLAAGLAAGPHELVLRRRNEASLGATEIFGLTAPGGRLLPPPAAAGRRIEVVGASIETGYGVGGTEGVDCGAFLSSQQDQGRAWPQLAADLLGAELMNTSYSGKGMGNNISISLDPVHTMPVMARLAEPTDFAHAWDPARFVPDVVAIAMGSNDWEGTGGDGFDPNRLVEAYVAFLGERLQEAPAAAYYVTISPQIYAQERADVSGALAEVVARARAGGATGVRLLEFPEYDGAAKSCDGHPPPSLHATMAAQVAAAVRRDVGW